MTRDAVTRPAVRPAPRVHEAAGRRFDERHPVAPPGVPVPRVVGPVERAWAGADHDGRRDLLARLRAAGSPVVVDEGGTCTLTWWYEDADARAVVLAVNGLLDHRDVGASELVRLAGSDVWTITYRLPGDWRGSYVLTTHRGDGPAPWRTADDRRTVRLAAMAGGPDPANPRVMGTMHDAAVSVAQGTAAPPHRWWVPGRPSPPAELVLPATAHRRARRVWLHTTPGLPDDREAPLLVVHDGQVWARSVPLAASLDAAVADGALPPLRAVLVDSGTVATRWEELGVPGGTTRFVLDDLLPVLAGRWALPADPTRVVATGASFGGLGALWLVALGGDRVGAALAQSPSLWRFDLRDVLRAAPRHVRVALQAGVHEPEVLRGTRELAAALVADGRSPHVVEVTGGHDWAWWWPGMLDGLTQLLPPDPCAAPAGATRVAGITPPTGPTSR